MTREEAIKIIDCYDIGFYDLSGEKIPADKLADAFDMAIEALQAEPVKHGEWIPCSDRLPSKDEGVYLVTDYCPLINRRRIRIAYCYANKNGFWSDTPPLYEVLAWMPLPKPYCIYNKDKLCDKETICLNENVADSYVGCPDAEWKSEVEE